MKKSNSLNLRQSNQWLRDPILRKEMLIRFIISTQAMEGITTTRAQAEAAYEAVQREKKEKRA